MKSMSNIEEQSIHAVEAWRGAKLRHEAALAAPVSSNVSEDERRLSEFARKREILESERGVGETFVAARQFVQALEESRGSKSALDASLLGLAARLEAHDAKTKELYADLAARGLERQTLIDATEHACRSLAREREASNLPTPLHLPMFGAFESRSQARVLEEHVAASVNRYNFSKQGELRQINESERDLRARLQIEFEKKEQRKREIAEAAKQNDAAMAAQRRRAADVDPHIAETERLAAAYRQRMGA
jgi:hypothetical protein